MTCKHDWHFVGETTRLRCERCGQETGPRTPDQLAQDLLKDVVTIGSAWSKGGERIDPLSVYKSMDDILQEARQAELDACCDLLEGMHAATTGSHNYYLHAAVELRRLRGKP